MGVGPCADLLRHNPGLSQLHEKLSAYSVLLLLSEPHSGKNLARAGNGTLLPQPASKCVRGGKGEGGLERKKDAGGGERFTPGQNKQLH